MGQSAVLLLFGLVTVIVSFVYVEIRMREIEIRHKKDVREAMDDLENAYTNKINTVKDELDKVYINNIRNVKVELNEIESRFKREVNKLETEMRPAFSATFTNDRAIPLTHGEILKFDNVHLNIGEGYDPATGHFTVPKAGIYLVSSTIRSTDNKHIHAYLWKNYDRLLLAYGRNWKTGSFSFPINLQKGDLLLVRHDDGPNIADEAVHGGYASFFAATFISSFNST